jgi:predicted ABC-type sugar transport system permease subunit
MAVGVLLVVVGAVWTLQGLNVLTDSQMSDQPVWAVIGPIVAAAGLILIILGARTRARFKRREAAASS